MESMEAIEVLRQGIYTLLIVGAPPLMIALLVGLVISLFQALTQIQEATLTFVPKIVALMLTLVVTLPWIFDTLTVFTQELYNRIALIE